MLGGTIAAMEMLQSKILKTFAIQSFYTGDAGFVSGVHLAETRDDSE